MVWRFRPHFIIVRLTNPSRADISTLQGCCVLAGGIPVIIAMSMSRNEPAIGVLEEWVEALVSLPVRPDATKKILDELEPSDRDSEKRALAVSKN
jgi:hypothetical protein